MGEDPAAALKDWFSQVIRKHENTKKRAYEQRVCEIEHGSFTPTGGLENAAAITGCPL